MAERDILHQISGDLRLALGLLTRLPLPGEPDVSRGARAAWAWPLAGLAPAIAAALAITMTGWLGLPVAVQAGLGLALAIALTGAMHEDGLADTADGLWGGWTVERRLEIMKDSRIGTYGVIALVLSLLVRWSLIMALVQAGAVWGGLLAVALLSRVPMVALMAWMDPARPGGLSRAVGRPELRTAGIATGLAVTLAVVCTGPVAILAGISGALVAFGLGQVAQAKIGGQTGDILGAAQQLADITALAVIVAAL